MYEGLVNNLRKAADKWEKGHPIIGVGELRVHDALRDAARALNEASVALERATLERNAAVESLRDAFDCCKFCKYLDGAFGMCKSTPKSDHSCFEWRGVKEDEHAKEI